jgi:hypothetical protein
MISYATRLAAALLVLLIPWAAAAGTGKPLPAIQFHAESYTFSPVLEGDIVTHEFTFENRGNAELRITKLRTD